MIYSRLSKLSRRWGGRELDARGGFAAMMGGVSLPLPPPRPRFRAGSAKKYLTDHAQAYSKMRNLVFRGCERWATYNYIRGCWRMGKKGFGRTYLHFATCEFGKANTTARGRKKNTSKQISYLSPFLHDCMAAKLHIRILYLSRLHCVHISLQSYFFLSDSPINFTQFWQISNTCL